MRHVGIDAHKHYAHVVEINAGEVTADYRVPLPDGLEEFKKRLGPDAQVVLEASTSSFRLHEELAPRACRVVVAHPAQTRGAVAHAAMTDRKAAEALARLLASDFVRPVWVPPAETRALRTLVEHRTNLTRMHSGLVKQVRALLQQELHPDPGAHLLKKEGLSALEHAFPPGSELQYYLNSLLRLRQQVSAEKDGLDKLLWAWCLDSREVRLLLGLPGVGPVVAAYMMAAIGDVARFPSPRHLCSYAGLVPRVHQSGMLARRGGISRAGRGSLRWAAWMAGLHATRHPGPLRDFYLSLSARRPKMVALVATSRKLLTQVWHLLQGRCEPRDYDSSRAAKKFEALERKASRSQRAPEPVGSPGEREGGEGERLRRLPKKKTGLTPEPTGV